MYLKELSNMHIHDSLFKWTTETATFTLAILTFYLNFIATLTSRYVHIGESGGTTDIILSTQQVN